LKIILIEEVKNVEIPRDQTKGKTKTQKTKELHEIRRHKWQDNMNLY